MWERAGKPLRAPSARVWGRDGCPERRRRVAEERVAGCDSEHHGECLFLLLPKAYPSLRGSRWLFKISPRVDYSLSPSRLCFLPALLFSPCSSFPSSPFFVSIALPLRLAAVSCKCSGFFEHL